MKVPVSMLSGGSAGVAVIVSVVVLAALAILAARKNTSQSK